MLKFEGTLHGHTDFSNLRLRDSINTIKDRINYAIELGQSVIAFTEHETVANAVKIEKEYNKIKEKHPNFKVIRGNEIYLCRNGLNAENFNREQDRFYHFILLAKDAIGHQQIRELSSRAWLRSFSMNDMTRVPTYYQDLQEIIGTNLGHVIGSTACLGGFLAVKLLQYNDNFNPAFYKQIESWVLNMQSIFGKDDFYLEMQPSASEDQEIVNKLIIQLSEELGIPYIITCDDHYLKKEDAPIHKAFLNAQDGDREVDEFYKTTYLMDTDELESYMDGYMTRENYEYAYQNIIDIKNKCEDYSLLKSLKIPSLEWKTAKVTDEVRNKYLDKVEYLNKFYHSDFEGDKRLVDLVVNKIEGDKRLQTQEVYDELNENLISTWTSSEVNKTHWSSYFLNLQGIIEECWNAGSLVGPGRGSGVGFLLLYLLDIIQINPLWETTKTFSWRFLNPDRVSVLDIDTDIEGGRRSVVLEALRNRYGHDRVANVVTFGTEGTKSAIQTAARGLGIDVDDALYISSLVPSDRGKTRTLHECYYGDKEAGFESIPLFKNEMDNRPELWKVAQKIEGLICRVGEHAGGVIFVDEPFTNSTALMKVPNGDVVTQFDLHDCEDCSLIKIDLLSVECLDKIHACLDLLIEDGLVEEKSSLKETYESVLGIYNIERKNPKMWEMVWNHEIQSLFQMEQQSGVQGIALIHPKSVDELAVLNSVIRLMAPDEHSDQPLVMWSKYRQNINLWYDEMKKFGLTANEIDWLSHHSAITQGICESQEGLMSLVQEERLGGNSLTFADKCRKGIAKKQGSLFEECEKTFFKNIKEKKCSEILAHYVWDVLLRVQRGYSFNRSHCLAYSLVALQEMNLAFKYPIIYWNAACLITDTGGSEDISADSKTTNYDKIASGISKMQKAGINIAPPDINLSSYTFRPSVKENKIYFGLRGILNVGEDIINNTIANRPYSSPQDYIEKVKPKKSSMIALIKSGAFDSMMDRVDLMKWYIWETCDKKSRITLQNLPALLNYKLVPLDTQERKDAYKVYEFNRYLKAKCKSGDVYKLDTRAINFIQKIDQDDLITGQMTMNIKSWDKVYQKYIEAFREWINGNKEEILNTLNDKIYQEEWNKYAKGTLSAWEMEVLCFYYHEHELAHIDQMKYGCENFFSLPEEPEVERTVRIKGGNKVNIFKLHKICGTVIAKNKTRHVVSLLTTNGVVNVKFNKDYFSMFDRQIFVRNSDGTKTVIEKSWFNRGNMLMVQGIRNGDQFRPKKYSSTPGHQLYKIAEVLPNNDLMIISERSQGDMAEDVDSIRRRK